MLRRMLFVLVICTLLLFNASVTATPVAGVWNQTLPSILIYLPTPATSMWYFSSKPGANDTTSIKTLFETQFNVMESTTTTQCDNPTSQCANGANSGMLSNSIYTNEFISPSAINYLAVHFGGSEFLFYWQQAINDFKIEGLSNWLSNYKAHGNSVAVVPVPTSAWLFASGLGVFCVLRRRLHK